MKALNIALSVMLSATCFAAQGTDFGELYYQRASLFDTLGTNPSSIVMLGNSLTHGCEWHELLGNPNVVNRGINGEIGRAHV